MSDSKFPTDEPFDRDPASDREEQSAGLPSNPNSDSTDSHSEFPSTDSGNGDSDKVVELDVNADDEFRQPIEMYPRRNQEESAPTPPASEIEEDFTKDSTITPLSKEEYVFEHRPHIRKTGDPLYVDPEEPFNKVSELSVDKDEDDPLPARRNRFRPPSDGRRFGGSTSTSKPRATSRPAMTLVSSKSPASRSAVESSVARDRLKADEIQHEMERTRADIVALKLQNQHFGLDRRLADAGLVRDLEPPRAPPQVSEEIDDSFSDFESPVPAVKREPAPVFSPTSEQDTGTPTVEVDSIDDYQHEETKPPAQYIPDTMPDPAPPSYPLPNFQPGANTGSASPIHGRGMRGDIHVDISKGGIRFVGADGGEPVERLGFDESAAPAAEAEAEFAPAEIEEEPIVPLPEPSYPADAQAYDGETDVAEDVTESNVGFYPPAATPAVAQAAAGQADIDQQFAYFEQTAAQDHVFEFEAEGYVDDDGEEFPEGLDLEGDEFDVDDDRRGVAQKSVFEIDAPPDNEPLRVEPTTPASFKTMRNLVSERVHRHARNRRSDEQELERQVSGYRLKRSVIRIAFGLSVAISMIIGVTFLALDEPNVSREPSIRDILKDLPPLNPSEADGIAQTDSEAASEDPVSQRNSTVIIEPDAADSRTEVAADSESTEGLPAVAEQTTETEPQSAVEPEAVVNEPKAIASTESTESAESAPDASTQSPPAQIGSDLLPSSTTQAQNETEALSAEVFPPSRASTGSDVTTNAIDDEVLAGSAVPAAGSESSERDGRNALAQEQAESDASTEDRAANGIEITTTTLTAAGPAAATDSGVDTDEAAVSNQPAPSVNASDQPQPLEAEQVAAVMLPEERVSEDNESAVNSTASASTSTGDDAAVDESIQNSIDARMDVAWDQIASLRLTTPVGDNAFETVSNVLDSDPKNEEALSALVEIRNRYLQWAERAVDDGELDKAITNYQKVINVYPSDAGSITPVIAQLEKQAEAVELTAAVNDRAAPDYNPQQDQAREPTVVSSAESSNMSRARDQLAELDIEVTIRNLVELTNEGDYDAVKLLLESGLSVDSRAGQYGFSPLIVTAIRGDTGMLKLLLENEVDIDGRSSDGRTALMAAAWNGHQFIVNTLLENKASVQIANADGWTALHYAAWQGHLDIVRTLLDNGADPNVRNDDGWTVAETAEKKGFFQILEIIEGRGQG